MAQSQLVRYKTGKYNFEVMTNVGSALKYRKQELGLDNVIQADIIFKNQSKSERANLADLRDAFKTEDLMECIKQIIQKGEIQLTAAERKEHLEKKRKEIVNYIHKYYTDPKARKPHPVVRIDGALDEIKFRVDPDEPPERQAQEAVKKLVEVIPLKKSEVEGRLTVPNKMLGQVQGIISKYCTVRGETYTADGCAMEVALVPGDYDLLLADMNRITKGDFQFEIAGAAAATIEEAAKPAAKGKRQGGKRK